MGPNNGIIVFHYPFSPYAKRVLWYLQLRGIDYAQCLQPPTLPRPDVANLGVSYRRIPLLSIGRDIYCDTRLILQKLEERFPHGRIGASTPDQKAVEKLLEKWTIDGGVFVRAGQLIPPDLPLLKDPKFQKDREDYSGRSWRTDDMIRNRPEALVHIREAFNFMETTLLADGRDWILKTDKPSLADIEAIWIFEWICGLKGALPADLISDRQFTKVFGWIARFKKIIQGARASGPKPATIKGEEALQRVLSGGFCEPEGEVDVNDPLKLEKGQEVEVYPTDTGFNHPDRGTLVAINPTEVVLSTQTKQGGGEVRIHCPRTNFRTRPASSTSEASKL